MQFTTLTLAALASLASAATQTTHVVTVAMNSTLTYSPNKITAAVGDYVQFQFTAGNHTVSQSTFDAPCQPIAMHSNVTGFHSGFQPAAASASTGMIPTYTIQINNTTPIWAYCAQAKHCEAGMVMVINENTAANSTRSLTNFMSLAAKATTIIPGMTTASTSNSTSGSGSSSSGSSGSGSSGTTSGSGSTSSGTTSTSFGTTLSAPSTFGLFAMVAAAFML